MHERSTPPRLVSVRDGIIARLRDGGVPTAEVDADLILAHALGTSRGRVQALAVMDAPIADQPATIAWKLAEDRAQRVPLQHLTGRAAFRGLELSVGPGVFVPRPETETVAQHAIDALRAFPEHERRAVDLCTGSGAIALAIAQEVSGAEVWAIEKSAEAHAWAERNVAEYGGARVHLIRGDAADAPSLIPESVRGTVPVVISNPPYVPTGMVPRDPEVRDHDPEMALFSGSDGLDLIRILVRVSREIVAHGGVLVLEHAEHQGAAIRRLLTDTGWDSPVTHADLTGRDRATIAKR